MSNVNEWCADGISAEIDNLKELPSDIFPWWNQKVINNEVIILNTLGDIPKEESELYELLDEQDIKSLLVVPIIYTNKVLGYMGFDSVADFKQWTGMEIRLLRLVSEILGGAYNIISSQDKLRKSEEHYKSLIESIQSVVIVTDSIGQNIYANSKALDQLEVNSSDFEKTTLFDYFPEKFTNDILSHVNKVIESGKVFSEEEKLTIGSVNHWFKYSINPITEYGANINRVLIIFEDINQAKEQDLALAKFNERLKFLNRVSNVLIQEISTEKDFIQEVFNKLYDFVPATLATLNCVNLETNNIKVNTDYFWKGIPINEDFLNFKIEDFNQEDLANVLQLKTIIKTYDKYDENRYHNALKKVGIRSAIYVPIQMTNKHIGILTLQSVEKDFFTEEYVDIIEELGRLVQIGINQQNLYKQIQSQNEHLEKEVERRTKENVELNKFTSLLVESSGVAIISTDENNIVDQLNPKAEQLLGYRSEDIVGKEDFFLWISTKEQIV